MFLEQNCGILSKTWKTAKIFNPLSQKEKILKRNIGIFGRRVKILIENVDV